jgi:succinylglutamic semialdehyde dehydrogenase
MSRATSAIDDAVAAAKSAASPWASTPQPARNERIQAVAAEYKRRKSEIAETICRQTGKPRWEAAAEVDAMVNKAAISIAAQAERCNPTSRLIGDVTASMRYRPIGVLAVLGPFNMPGHLPNGHLMPAVLAGNTVVFKPSELTPQIGQIMADIWRSVGFPPGVFNLVQGGADVGAALVSHADIDGVLFTGSRNVGGAISKLLADHPEKMLALEMGGNNPLIVWDCGDLVAAAHVIVQSAFITSGQRCSCARRLIVPAGPAGDAIVERLIKTMSMIRVGLYADDPEPFMGPVISAKAADAILLAQLDLIHRGGKTLVEVRRDARHAALLKPGLIDMTGAKQRDEEIFGPLLQLIRVDDFDSAIATANRTQYGLSAGLLSDRPELFEKFRATIRAGVVNFNSPLTGARSDLPFGGIGFSGNHRPGAYFAADYCRDPVASLESPRVVTTKLPGVNS